MRPGGPRIEDVSAAAYRIPTDAPEADGTIAWDATTLVLVRVRAGSAEGLGYTYASAAAASVAAEVLLPGIAGCDAFAIEDCWWRMAERVRNAGREGICAMAISAVDVALWDLKAKALGLPLATLLGQVRESAAVYGSGGFTSYSIERLQEQLGGWARHGISRAKMKVGTQPGADPGRVRAAREAIGDAALFVDANGAYETKQALSLAEAFAAQGVSWFEEPVSSNDLAGLAFVRGRVPAGMQVAAGEYGFTPGYFRRMLAAGAVDVLQADATRCGGITGFLKAAALCEAFEVPLSSHCAPALHVAVACAARPLLHMEYFHDHVRIEGMLFDGVPPAEGGRLAPNLGSCGHGLTFRESEGERYRV